MPKNKREQHITKQIQSHSFVVQFYFCSVFLNGKWKFFSVSLLYCITHIIKHRNGYVHTLQGTRRMVNRSITRISYLCVWDTKHTKDKNGSHKLIHVLCTVKYVFTFISYTFMVM